MEKIKALVAQLRAELATAEEEVKSYLEKEIAALEAKIKAFEERVEAMFGDEDADTDTATIAATEESSAEDPAAPTAE